VINFIGYFALFFFFAVVISSLKGIIPQNKLPIQTALLFTTVVLVILSYIGRKHGLTPVIVPRELMGNIILHPITALLAGFFVAGALEVAGGFKAAADFLDRLSALKLRKKEIFGLPGTVMILVNLPTIISMPCGRILGAALMPAALFFGKKVADRMNKPFLISVVVFTFIVNAAASCGPSPLGGIGMLGEGMTGTELGTFSDPQQGGILLCTALTALLMSKVTKLVPAGYEKKEREAEKDEQ
jgi:hypothetical protein